MKTLSLTISILFLLHAGCALHEEPVTEEGLSERTEVVLGACICSEDGDSPCQRNEYILTCDHAANGDATACRLEDHATAPCGSKESTGNVIDEVADDSTGN